MGLVWERFVWVRECACAWENIVCVNRVASWRLAWVSGSGSSLAARSCFFQVWFGWPSVPGVCAPRRCAAVPSPRLAAAGVARRRPVGSFAPFCAFSPLFRSCPRAPGLARRPPLRFSSWLGWRADLYLALRCAGSAPQAFFAFLRTLKMSNSTDESQPRPLTPPFTREASRVSSPCNTTAALCPPPRRPRPAPPRVFARPCLCPAYRARPVLFFAFFFFFFCASLPRCLPCLAAAFGCTWPASPCRAHALSFGLGRRPIACVLGRIVAVKSGGK